MVIEKLEMFYQSFRQQRNEK